MFECVRWLIICSSAALERPTRNSSLAPFLRVLTFACAARDRKLLGAAFWRLVDCLSPACRGRTLAARCRVALRMRAAYSRAQMSRSLVLLADASLLTLKFSTKNFGCKENFAACCIASASC